MAIRYTKEQREQLSKDMAGKKVEKLYYEDGDTKSGPYWVMEFEGGGEICFRFMSEIVS